MSSTPKTCKVCSTEHKTGCQLSHAVCPYRDVETLEFAAAVEELNTIYQAIIL